MILNNPIATLNTDANDKGTVTSVSVTAQLSELFGNTQGKLIEIGLVVLPSEYSSNIEPTALLTLIKSKIKDRLTNGQLAIYLLNINYNGPTIHFTTADADAVNTLTIEATLMLTTDEMATAVANGLDGINAVVRNKLIVEFS
jgi:hypothetical protein